MNTFNLKNLNLKRQDQKKRSGGFVILFTVIIAVIVLAIALGVSNVAVKEALLSAPAKEGQIAFFAADTGLECALYWDIQQDSFNIDNPATDPVNCASGVNFVSIANPYAFFVDILDSGAYRCALVTVDKQFIGQDGGEYTNIQSRGYNKKCSATSAANAVERLEEVRYLNPVIVLAQCEDGLDNDGDGDIDVADSRCHSDGNASNPASYVPSDDSEIS